MALDLSLVGQPTPPQKFKYGWKDVALYALGVGAKRDELDVLYEGRGPKVLPSFAVVPTFEPLFSLLSKTGGDLSMVVHGGQRVRVHRPIPPQGTLLTTAVLRGIYDLRRFASVVGDTTTTDEDGQVLFTTTWTIIFRGEGGFGGESPPKSEVPSRPRDREPDFRIEETTSPEQALLYRLSGDFNPLHADPEFAAKVGFDKGPILHGLCTYGFMVRHLANGLLGGDASKIAGFEAQFRRPVWPGDTLVTEGYRHEDGKTVNLTVTVKERNEAVLGSAWAELA